MVPKKGGMTVVANDKNELIPTRTVTGWRMCIEEGSLSVTVHGSNDREVGWPSLLLFLGRVFGV